MKPADSNRPRLRVDRVSRRQCDLATSPVDSCTLRDHSALEPVPWQGSRRESFRLVAERCGRIGRALRRLNRFQASSRFYAAECGARPRSEDGVPPAVHVRAATVRPGCAEATQDCPDFAGCCAALWCCRRPRPTASKPRIAAEIARADLAMPSSPLSTHTVPSLITAPPCHRAQSSGTGKPPTIASDRERFPGCMRREVHTQDALGFGRVARPRAFAAASSAARSGGCAPGRAKCVRT